MNKNYFGCAWRIVLSCECEPGSHKIKGSNHAIAAFDFMIVIAMMLLYNALCHHGFCYFQEACHVRAFYVVDVAILACTIFNTCAMDVVHNLV